jgi:hypothetical protein
MNSVVIMTNAYRKVQKGIPNHNFHTTPSRISDSLVSIAPILPDDISEIITLEPGWLIQ